MRVISIVGSQGGRGGGGGPPGGGAGSRSHSSKLSTTCHSLPISMPIPAALRAGIATSIGPGQVAVGVELGRLGEASVEQIDVVFGAVQRREVARGPDHLRRTQRQVHRHRRRRAEAQLLRLQMPEALRD